MTNSPTVCKLQGRVTKKRAAPPPLWEQWIIHAGTIHVSLFLLRTNHFSMSFFSQDILSLRFNIKYIVSYMQTNSYKKKFIAINFLLCSGIVFFQFKESRKYNNGRKKFLELKNSKLSPFLFCPSVSYATVVDCCRDSNII